MTASSSLPEFIDRQQTFDELVSELRACKRFAFDTEFISERHYRPRLCLLQIAAGDILVAVDPLRVNVAAFVELLDEPGIEKIVHAGRQDLMIFYHFSGRAPVGVFDTQIAAALLGYGDSIGLAKLIEAVTGNRVKSGESFTDWSQRPLSPSQITYALDDVRYLEEITDQLQSDLNERGRMEWVAQEHRIFDDEGIYRRDPETVYRKVKSAQKMSRKELAVLQSLARWREEEAERRDSPRGRILADDALAALARRAPTDERRLREMRGLHGRFLDRYGATLLDLIREAVAVPEDGRPEPVRAASKDPRFAVAVDLMELFLKSRAADLEISPGYLATRSQLFDLCDRHSRGDATEDTVPVRTGWRNELIGQDLVKVLDGEIGLTLDPKSMTVVVTR